jgi:hypothetical protein
MQGRACTFESPKEPFMEGSPDDLDRVFDKPRAVECTAGRVLAGHTF